MENRPMKAVIYIRVSTDEQGQSGAGLSAQLTACIEYAAKINAEVVAVHQDVASGSTMPQDRPGLTAAFSALNRDTVLIVAKRDRLGRDKLVLATIDAAAKASKSKIVSAAGEGTDQSGAAAVLMSGVFDAVAAFERERIRERTRDAMQAMKKQGRRVGDIPLGKQLAEDGRTLIDNPAEAEAVAIIERLKAAGLSLRDIAAELTAAGIAPRGKAWHANSIRRVLMAG